MLLTDELDVLSDIMSDIEPETQPEKHNIGTLSQLLANKEEADNSNIISQNGQHVTASGNPDSELLTAVRRLLTLNDSTHISIR